MMHLSDELKARMAQINALIKQHKYNDAVNDIYALKRDYKGIEIPEYERFLEWYVRDMRDRIAGTLEREPQAWFNAAYDSYKKGYKLIAVLTWEFAEACSPEGKYPGASNNRGLALQELGHYEAEIGAYEKAEGDSPEGKYPDASYNRGIALRELGRYAEAIGAYEKAEGDSPEGKFPVASNNRGNALGKLGRYAAAIGAYEKAEGDSPEGKFPVASYNRGNALRELGRYAEAIGAFEKAEGDSPGGKYPDASYNRGIALRELGRYEAAIGAYEKAEGDSPEGKFPDASKNRGYVLEKIGHYESAIGAFEKAEGDSPDGKFPVASYNRGYVLEKLGHYEAAIGAYEKAEGDSPEGKFPLASNNRGNALQKLGRYAEAIGAYEKAEGDSPEGKYPDASINKAILYYNIGTYPKAIEACNKAVADSKDTYVKARVYWSKALFAQGRKPQAYKQAVKAILIDSNDLFGIGHLCAQFKEEAVISAAAFKRYQNRQAYLLQKNIESRPDNVQAYGKDTLDKYELPVFDQLDKFLLILGFEALTPSLSLSFQERLTLAYLTAYSHQQPWRTYDFIDNNLDSRFALSDMDLYFYLSSSYHIADDVTDLTSTANLGAPKEDPIFYAAFQTLSQAIKSAEENKQFADEYLLEINPELLKMRDRQILETNRKPEINDALAAILDQKPYEIPMSDTELTGMLVGYLVQQKALAVPDYVETQEKKLALKNFRNELLSTKRDYKDLAALTRKMIRVGVPYQLAFYELTEVYIQAEQDSDRHNIAIMKVVALVSHYLDYLEKPIHESILFEAAAFMIPQISEIIPPPYKRLASVTLTLLVAAAKKTLKDNHKKNVETEFERILSELR
ncbi:Tetratricopeptide repeat-containing protein [Cyclonatronum proteinivorum]|uniref:Tetratricopeptide repeat-containing protein n=1 Tax=Cyclonatronum proteinivorum TaxID=1457365 RepID=A0A345UL78_9BACT|nr:tetratricopeptide repeat protein [Cyclonatronum proteinivorum]AXJ01230.1 Tetratricopeptide repeat-containing protein [Cyclonatronum proteinivorum]